MSLGNNLKAIFLKILTKKRSVEFDLKHTNKVLMLRYDRIGDMIITTPVFRELKRAYPNIEINVLASKSNSIVLKNNPNVDNVYLNNKHNFFADIPLLLKLRRERIDVCFEFDHSVVRHAILRLIIINPKKVISIKKYGRYGVSASQLDLYDYYTDSLSYSHFRDIWLNMLSPFGVKPLSNKYDIFFDKVHEIQSKKYLRQYKNKLLFGINLEGAVKGKKIQYQYLNEICKGLFEINNNIHIVIIHPPEKENDILNKLEKMNLNYVTKSYTTNNILSLSALIKNLDIIITPDTSIVHIASTFNKPVVSIHEDNLDSFKLFAPTSDFKRTIFSTHRNSLQKFSVKQLLKATEELVDLLPNESFKSRN
jgi:ADP-heptose:LPS heptosyltransferase